MTPRQGTALVKLNLPQWMLGLMLLFGGVGGTAAAAPKKTEWPPVARAIESGRETRRTALESPRSALDAQSALAAANAIAGHIRGARVFTVKPTGSMRPVFNERALLVVEPTRYEDLRVGDIVTYRHPKLDTPVVHRILEKRPQGLWTKGDHCERPDDVYVTPENYLMRVFAIIYAREDVNLAVQSVMAKDASRMN